MHSGIVRTLASICLSSAVGRWVDQAPSRLKTLLSTISVNRISVIGASIIWFFIVGSDTGAIHERTLTVAGIGKAIILKDSLFALILVLGTLENLSASGNILSMERDWVVAASSPDGRQYDLTDLNSTMRRIDLTCKLIAPILISFVISATNVKIGVLVVGGMSAASWVVELWCARRVWNLNPRLREPKAGSEQTSPDNDALPPLEEHRRTCWSNVSQGVRNYTQDFKNYFFSLVWIPSLSLAFLHISSLTYSATFITYLLAVGFSLDIITIARAAGSIVEIISTVVTPFGVQILSKAQHHGRFRGRDRTGRESEDSIRSLLDGASEVEGRTETGLERLGLWGISFQLVNLVLNPPNRCWICTDIVQAPVVFALWQLSPSPGSASSSLPHLVSRILAIPSQPLLAFILFFFLSISRLGLWIYDLTTQQLTQTMVSPTQRSSFTGVEYSFVSLFELAQFVITIILYKPEQFKWIAIMSWVAVLVSTVAYAGWVWKMRGHLVHWERIGKGCECAAVRHGHWGRGWRSRIGDTLSLSGRSQIR
jgi:iron-regulated transporter 1